MSTVATIDNKYSETSSEKINKKLILRSKKKTVAKKNIHMILKGEDVARLEALRERVDPHTQTEVIINSLQLFDEILREYDSGSTFLIKRDGEEAVEYEIFG